MKTTESTPNDVSSVLSVIPSSTYNILSNLKHSREAVSRLYLYGVLGVGKHATEKEIKEAYRRKALKHHPDRNGGVESDEFTKIADAYAILSDPILRKVYNFGGLEAVKNFIKLDEVWFGSVIKSLFIGFVL